MPSKKQKLWALLALVVLLALAGCYELRQSLLGVPEEYERIEEHFKYGSIGSDNLKRGLPYWIWKVLPDLFPDKLPRNGKTGYQALGLNVERGMDRPIGFSKRRFLGVDLVGVNCAFCHVSTLRPTAGAKPKIILGMPGNTVNIEGFFKFLFETAGDARFTTGNVMEEIRKADPAMGFVERVTFRFIMIPLYKHEVLRLKEKFNFLYRPARTEFGPGRVETWVAYKVLKLQEPLALLDLLPVPEFGPVRIDQDPGDVTGLADFPAIWPEKINGMQLHWDGNNPDLQERNIIASFGAGVTAASLDVPRLTRLTQWVAQLPPPWYKDSAPPDPRPSAAVSKLTASGKQIYDKECAYCHDVRGSRVRMVEPIGGLGTDRSRLDSFTDQLKDKLNKVGEGYPWRLHRFVKTDGYANMLLDGIWLRAPYLHNGSVPTLRDLLEPPANRPSKFCRGNDEYDWDKVGFKFEPAGGGCGRFFKYDTALKGNHNTGHEYGTNLSPAGKDALVEYLKTL